MRRLCFLVLLGLAYGGAITIDKNNGGYENIIVGIHPSVPYNEDLITNIKVFFQQASDFLHEATNGRVYFKQVTIAVPETWPDRPAVQWTSANLYESSNIHIAEPNPQYNDTPYTRQPRGCGEPGEFIHFTPEFIISLNTSTKQDYGDPAHHLVHEWAHLRYGVFDEYGIPGDKENPSLYCENGKVVANTCTRAKFLLGTRGQRCTMIPPCHVLGNCVPVFVDGSKEASIMSMPDTASKFCDRSEARKHNPGAPNKQNKICNKKPTWEVITGNPDFVGLPGPNLNKNTTVTFREVQKSKSLKGRVVFVLDVSGSMKLRLNHVKNAATFYIQHVIHEGVGLGIVRFSDNATILHDVEKINAANRIHLSDTIESLVSTGGTAIGMGLEMGLMALKKDGHSAEGGILVLMTDGRENVAPFMNEVLPTLMKEHVVVNTFAVGNAADKKLEQLASATGGNTYFFNDLEKNLEMFMEVAFAQSTNGRLDPYNGAINIIQLAATLLGQKEFNFTMDKALGINTTLEIVSDAAAKLDVIVISPAGSRCDHCVQTRKPGRINIEIPTPSQQGVWRVFVNSTTGGQPVISMRVYSSPRNASEHPIRLRVLLNRRTVSDPLEARVYAEVMKGGNAVLGATVTAVVRRPVGDNVVIQLHDNGTGADTTAGDGMYSAYFTQFSGEGRYSVVVIAQHGANTTITKGYAVASGSRRRYPRSAMLSGVPAESYRIGDQIKYDDQVNSRNEPRGVVGIPAEEFQRVSDGGSFQTTRSFTTSEIPPGAITDMIASRVNRSIDGVCSVLLSWTCPGAHMDFDQASHIELRASLDPNELAEKFETALPIVQGDLQSGHLSLLAPGSRQQMEVKMTKILPRTCDSSSSPDVYFAARAWNHENIHSKVSNIAAAYTSQFKQATTSIILSG